MLHPLSLYRVSALSVLLCLSACTGSAVLHADSRGTPTPIAEGSLAITVNPHPPQLLVSKHERGAFSHPKLTEDEQRAANARGLALEATLARELPQQLNDRLARYANHDGRPANGLILVLERIAVDTDGSADVTVSAVLGARGSKSGWLRTVLVSASRFGSDTGIARDCSDAIVAQLKASGLLR